MKQISVHVVNFIYLKEQLSAGKIKFVEPGIICKDYGTYEVAAWGAEREARIELSLPTFANDG